MSYRLRELLSVKLFVYQAGYDYLATAAHFAAESSTGTNVNVCTTDDFTKAVDALVYYIDPEEEELARTYRSQSPLKAPQHPRRNPSPALDTRRPLCGEPGHPLKTLSSRVSFDFPTRFL